MYGSNAVGAVINIITKKPQHKFEAGAHVISESHNTWQTKVNVGTQLKRCSARASFFRNSSDGFGADSEGPYAARYESWGSNLKLGYRPFERSYINVLGRFFSHETFNPAGSMNVKHSLTHTISVGANGGYTSKDKRNNIHLSVNWDKYFDYDVMERQANEKRQQNTSDYISSRFVDTYHASERVELVAGLEHNYQQIFATKTLGVQPTTKSINDANLFAQTEWEMFHNFDVVAGARYTYNEQFKSAFTPKLSLMYECSHFKFRGGVGTAFRAPSIKELYYDFDHQGMFWVYGNSDLKAENGLYTSFSVEYTKGLFNASISGYYNDIDNKITQFDVINKGAKEKYYRNVSSATLKGIDFNLSYLFWKVLTLKGSYSYCDAQDNSTGLQLSSNVKHSGVASLTWNGALWRSPFSFQLSGRFHSPILYQEVVSDDEGGEQLQSEESKAYSIWKATLVKPFRINKHTIELTLKCDNLFSFSDAAYVNPGRQFMVGLRYAFK